ncbi:MAG: thiamine diphosphokinase [Anaerolineae bacterium]
MHVLIVANGAPADLPAQKWVPQADLVIAADGGAANAGRLGLRPSVIIGDMDSIAPADRAELEVAGVQFVRYPTNKDATDLELALRYAVEQGAQAITLVGAMGGRPDQMLANVFLLTLPFLDGVAVNLRSNGWEAFCVRSAVQFGGQPGDVVSLLPLTPEVVGVKTAGLFWALDDATLRFGSTLGISNEMTGAEAHVVIREGVLLVVHRVLAG